MANNDYWTSKLSNGRWAVKKSSSEKAASLLITQEGAWKEARRLARGAGSEAFLTDRDGLIRTRNSYGHDVHSDKNQA
jgi:hypothetical protein